MRLLEFTDDGDLSLFEFFENAIPKYAILSHRWEAEEARRDCLQYFWVDTCCIDKSSSAELSEAINSMFRYKWFTRGWTLQELIAPESVEFFSKARELLGNKSTLERQTTRGEDQAYCLLGIFDISIPVIYGEEERRRYSVSKKRLTRRQRVSPLLCF
ncbi:hypothetical protein BDZ45DRAFT_704155 [Acephala macrosclerotiorum]|nr:hypothetical protein BDZ45DRAFT_704155 [Acephala macrosclerotiorum]